MGTEAFLQNTLQQTERKQVIITIGHAPKRRCLARKAVQSYHRNVTVKIVCPFRFTKHSIQKPYLSSLLNSSIDCKEMSYYCYYYYQDFSLIFNCGAFILRRKFIAQSGAVNIIFLQLKNIALK